MEMILNSCLQVSAAAQSLVLPVSQLVSSAAPSATLPFMIPMQQVSQLLGGNTTVAAAASLQTSTSS